MGKILIIDDDWQIHQLVGGFLRQHGYQIDTASNGGQGLMMAAATQPDLILCDLDMPGMNGQGVVFALRQDDKLGEIPVVFLSGCTERQQIRRSMNLGGDDFITKPAELPEILDAVNARLSRAGQKQRQTTQQVNQAADFIAGIINNLRPAGTDIKWWSGTGDRKFDHPNPIIQRMLQVIENKPLAKIGGTTSPPASAALLIKDDKRQKYLQLSEVKAFIASGEYSTVCWGDDRHMMYRKALKQWAKELPPEQFVRVHRSAIINLAFLDYVEKDEAGKRHIHLLGFKDVIPVSQRARPLFNRCLKKFRPLKPV